MAQLTIHYPTATERDATKDALAGIAANFGYYTVHKSRQRGDIRDLLGAIVGGEIALVMLSDEQRLATVNELRRFADEGGTDWIARDAFHIIADALSVARQRDEDGL